MLLDGLAKKTIVRQRVAEGQAAVKPTSGPPNAAPGASMTHDQILSTAEFYETDMKHMVAHAEELRLDAYHAKDLIRMNYIAGKLSDMREIQAITEPALATLRQPGQDMFVMLAKLSTIRQGWEHVKQSMSDAEASSSDTTDPTMESFAAANGQTSPSGPELDPTAPPSPSVEVERPMPASPFR